MHPTDENAEDSFVFHRWASNEDWDVDPFMPRDNCLVCGVNRYLRMPTLGAHRNNAVAAGSCPGRPWRTMPESDIRAAIVAYEKSWAR